MNDKFKAEEPPARRKYSFLSYAAFKKAHPISKEREDKLQVAIERDVRSITQRQMQARP